MLKNNEERKSFIRKSVNTLVFQNDEIGIRAFKLELPNGDVIVDVQEYQDVYRYGTGLVKDWEHTKYMILGKEKTDRSIPLSYLCDYLREHKDEFKDLIVPGTEESR